MTHPSGIPLLPTQPLYPLSDHDLMNRLEHVVTTGWQNPFYRTHWGVHRLEDALSTIRAGAFHHLPVIRKQHLRDHWAQLMHFEDAVDVVSSSGTTGRPVDIPVHRDDEALRILRVRRLLHELGVRPGTRVLHLLSLNDLFTLGPVAWQAIKAEGGCPIRCSPQRLERILQIITYLRPQVVIGNPFVMARLAEEAGERWPAPDLLPDLAFLAVAATFDIHLHPTPIAQVVKERWGLREVLNQYGSSELGPIAFECLHHQGLHIHADHHLIELIDPHSGERLTDTDQPGEIVLTALSFPRGFLPIRYATGDIAGWLHHAPCSCGRSTPRLGPILGRVDHQLKIFGQTVFPDLLLSVVDQCVAIRYSAVRVQRDRLGSDTVVVLIVPAEGYDSETVRRDVAARIAQNVAVAPEVAIVTQAELTLLEQHTAQHTNMVKIARFFDLRQEANAL